MDINYFYFFLSTGISTGNTILLSVSTSTSVASRESRVDGDVDAVERIEIAVGDWTRRVNVCMYVRTYVCMDGMNGTRVMMDGRMDGLME